MKALADRAVVGTLKRILRRLGLAAIPLACAAWVACGAKETQVAGSDPSRARQCEREDTFSREIKPGCRVDYLCDVNGHWTTHTPACAMSAATSLVPPPAPPACPTTMPTAGTPCEGPLTCGMSRSCPTGDLVGEAYFTCEGGVWRALVDKPCVPPCAAAVAKSHACGATPYCYLAGDACAHAGCWASAWNDGASGQTPWPCAPPAPPPAPPSPESCKREAATNPDLAQCKWTVGTMGYCGGAPPPRDMPRSWPGCLCNGCLEDRDCGAGSTCASIGSTDCLPAAKVCVKKAECVGDDRTCVGGCLHDGAGHGGCFPHAPPRP